ncbi:hypothetical protein SDC9_141581 [bioreactor metagenome]|uniref:Uncharacterized protein n=1 Tax=bioreactor metagenome TaxID=1076179 RepID=A0A645DYN7_9ZZZZ
MGADGAGDKGQGVFLHNQPQCVPIPALMAQLDILRNILPDGTAALAGGGEAAQQRHLFIQLPPGQGLDRLDVVFIPPRLQRQRLDALHIHGDKRLVTKLFQLLGNLLETLIAAGLQLCGGHGNGPNTAGKQLVDVEEVRAAGIGQAQPPAEFRGDAADGLAVVDPEAADTGVRMAQRQPVVELRM